ncbi:error-prone DNA polymerase [Marinobacter halophilus]|uniref:Error-prone DNA polymerase n=1 Tax=Marinobacter halophilus TaxID=1323740 RepID=A0A2T1KHX1_9GAMM|nr:error-prone DNA polymerase [Marinobacter halophilus]PSF09739.1 error-prone DNA polymerase [Marinobacter halophilus]GGC79415.1 error-prone DNA polymerase [Marinobacter halophilus]
MTTGYAELFCFSNFTFLTGASHPHELAERALELGYNAIAITDACSVAGIPRAWAALKDSPVKLITGSWFELADAPAGAAAPRFILLAQTRKGYGQLCQLITTSRRRAEKGQYLLFARDLECHELDNCLCLWLPPTAVGASNDQAQACGEWLLRLFEQRLRLAAHRTLESGEDAQLARVHWLAGHLRCPVVATGEVHMHSRERQPLQDVLTALRNHRNLENAGHCLFQNGERYLRPVSVLQRLFPAAWLKESVNIANSCNFEPGSLRYEYPPDLVPVGETPAAYLKRLTRDGERRRYPEGTPMKVQALIRKELGMISELNYEHYFLTIHDIVAFARGQGILCQGRGSAANSAVCYCLGITEVNPARVELLFERFISKDRDEPPDIDVDFEHQRREEVIQYIYQRYGRERAALAATVIRYRPRSAIRDVGKALGFDAALVEKLLDGIDWRDKATNWRQQILDKGLTRNPKVADQFFTLVNTLLGFPRHLSQHVGGFVISAGPLAELVPVENAAMADRTVIQWDKDDLESLGLMKVDVLALGMLTAIRKALELISEEKGQTFTLQDVPQEDPDTYAMLQTGDSIGVFQVESRAQINMLPRLKPATYYDLVIEVAIVRPGPIQGDMVHPYLRRKHGLEPVDYPNDAVRQVLERTLGVPIFQEQVIKLAMVAAGFSAGEADKLRRAMAAWKSHGNLTPFRDRLVNGMLERGHDPVFAERLYMQICGFGGYGFPESHAASFALLVYVSAWIKRHHPSAFYCALLNSQPMGFYSPSQLVQDAQRHNVVVLPPDVNHSHWEHSLQGPERHLRLGLRIIQGLSAKGGNSIHQHRPRNGYQSAAELRARAGLHQRDMELLAGANAMPGFTRNRHQAYWQLLEHEEPAELFAKEAVADYQPEPCDLLPEPTEGQNVLADYRSQGLTLQRHPLALLREQGHLRHCLSADQLKATRPGVPVQVAGLVTGRQRPGTASGVTFVTLEDETGNVNVVVWLETARRQRKPLLTARLLHVKGVIEKEGDIIHVMAGKLSDLSHLINSLPVSSRDFH